MQESITFTQKVVIGFSDLVSDLENRIFKKLSEHDFFNSTFEVINVTHFELKEMLVSGNTVICTVNVTADCNNPAVGKIINISNYDIRENTIIYTCGRIQIIAKNINRVIKKNNCNVKIEAVKLVSKNILCVGIIVE